jgi:antitoxin component YwqK of YwqJK toxin-antitoxin module
MLQAALVPVAIAATLLAFAAPARAVQSCELNGAHVNPDNGSTTAGKTGLMRCRDGDGGPVVREQELKGGVFMGVVRYFKDGVLEREYRVNEKGNRDGLAREYAKAEDGAKPQLVREETYRNGSTVGIARTWYPNGQPKRVSFHGDSEPEQAYAEFTPDGKLYELACAKRAVLAPYADDARWCGHVGGPSEVVLYSGKGEPKAKLVYERGERKKSEILASGGAVREQRETSATGGVERAFYDNGAKRREVQWLTLAGERAMRVTTLEQEFHESGKLVHEKRWKAGERGGELVSEQHWFLNGQPRDRSDYASVDGKTLRTETTFHDNGRKSSEGAWRVATAAARSSEQPTGAHRRWDSEGHLRAESVYDDRGRVTRERELDASGQVVRDDEVFEDGSRKAFGK